ncbi:beta-ketoacyl [acyl carrier protein] synthase domain-containing protein [Streptomyces sp. NPDC054796]
MKEPLHPTEPLAAVVGMGIIVPGASSPEEYWNVLVDGHAPFSEPSAFDIGDFHSEDHREADKVRGRVSAYLHSDVPRTGTPGGPADGEASRVETWLRHCLAQALQDVRVPSAEPVLCSMAVQPFGILELEEALARKGLFRLLAEVPDEHGAGPSPEPGESPVPARWLPRELVRCAARGLLPRDTDVLAVDSACSSGMAAIDAGLRAVWSSTHGIAVCGGSFALTPAVLIGTTQTDGQSSGGALAPFDEDANGTLFGDGAAVVVLKRLDLARRDNDTVHAVVVGSGMSHDGRGKGINAPDVHGQSIALTRALESCDLDPEAVRWVVSHGTSTPLGDATETMSVNRAYPPTGDEGPRYLTSNKNLIGHGSAAAGPASLIHAVLGLRHRTVPAQRDHRAPSARCDLGEDLQVPVSHTPLDGNGSEPPFVGVNGFGLGGTNIHTLVAPDPESAREHTSSPAAEDGDTEAIALVGCAADVPGGATAEELRAWLLGEAEASPPARFAGGYPQPAAGEFLIPGPQLHALDESHVSALRLFSELTSGREEELSALRPTTGVFAAHFGPTEAHLRLVLRCHADAVRRSPAGRAADPSGERWEKVLSELRAAHGISRYSLAGSLINLTAAQVSKHYGLMGPAFALEGENSGGDALRVARTYLLTGAIDLAYVVAFNGMGRERASFVQGQAMPFSGEHHIAEGGFGVLLARAGTRRALGLPDLGELSPALVERSAVPAWTTGCPGRTYLCADGLLTFLAERFRAISDTDHRRSAV